MCPRCGAPLAAANAPCVRCGVTPAPPASLKVIGVISIVYAALAMLANVALGVYAMYASWTAGAETASTVAIPIFLVVILALLGMLLAGGIGLVRAQPWGRTLCLWFAALVMPCWCTLTAMVTGVAAYESVEGNLTGSIHVIVGALTFAPLLGLVSAVILMTTPVKVWMAAVRLGGGRVTADSYERARAELALRPPVCGLAVVALFLSFMPGMMLTQLAAVVLGIVALAKISKSGGKLSGRGFAWGGIVIGAVLLVGVGGLIVTVMLAS